jgi:putative transposase
MGQQKVVFKLSPTEQQQKKLDKYLDSCRWVYNYFLDYRQKYYEQAKKENWPKKSPTYFDNIKKLKEVKQENEHLKEIANEFLNSPLLELQLDYVNFFKKRCSLPKPKKDDDAQFFSVYNKVIVKDGKLFISNFRDGIELVDPRDIYSKISKAKIVRTKTGDYLVSLLVGRDKIDLTSIGKRN